MSNYINKNLLDSSPVKKQKDEAKALVSKWDKTGLLDGLNEDFQRSGMAVMLENQARQLISENSATNPTGGKDEEWSGVALPLVRRIFGEIAAQDFVSVQPMNLPSGLVFYLDFKYGNSTSVHGSGESLFGKTGKDVPEGTTGDFGTDGFYGAGRYGYSANQYIASGTQNAQVAAVSASWKELNYDSEWSASAGACVGAANQALSDSAVKKVTVDITDSTTTGFNSVDIKGIRSFHLANDVGSQIIKPLPEYTTIAGNIISFFYTGSHGAVSQFAVSYSKAPSETARGDYEDTVGSGVLDSLAIPEVDLQLNSTPIVAKTRKLKAVWTPELAQDLNAYHSVDAEAELTSMLSEYISMEIDLEILDMLIQDAATTDYWSAKSGYDYNSTGIGDTFVKDTQFFGTRFEWWQTLVAKIQKVSNEIHKLTLRGGANFVVCGPKVSTILESLPGYNSNPGSATDKSFAMGVSKVGAVDGRFQVYKNPYMNENTILIGFRGSNFLETGAVYAPYVPLIMTPLVYDPSDFTPRKGVMTRYAKKLIRPEFYGKIHVADLNLV